MPLRAWNKAAVASLVRIAAFGAAFGWIVIARAQTTTVSIKEAFLQEAAALRRHRLSMTERRYGNDVLGDRALPAQARPLALDLRLELREGAVPRRISARVDDFGPSGRETVTAAASGGPEWLTLTLPSPPGSRLLRLTLEWIEGGQSRTEESFLPIYVGAQTDRLRLGLHLEERLRIVRIPEDQSPSIARPTAEAR